jgi:hypothetical protein
MAVRTITANAPPTRDISISERFGFGDSGSDQPGCIYVTVSFADDKGGSYQVTTWLETTPDKGATFVNANVPGFTSAQITTLKTQLISLYNAALTAKGFV